MEGSQPGSALTHQLPYLHLEPDVPNKALKHCHRTLKHCSQEQMMNMWLPGDISCCCP